MARENAHSRHRTRQSRIAELRQALDGVAMLAGWQLELVGRARTLLPDTVGGKAGKAPPQHRRRPPQP